RALDVAGGRDLLERRAVRERHEAREVVIQLRDVAVSPATVDDVMSPVLRIAEHHLVDRLRAVVKAIDERLAEIVLERAGRRTRPRDADAAGLLVVLDVVRAEEQVVPAAFLDDRGRP